MVKGNRKAAATFGCDGSYVQLQRKEKATISECEASWPLTKDDFTKLRMRSSRFFSREMQDMNKLHCTVVME